jgi:hypothetical protein
MIHIIKQNWEKPRFMHMELALIQAYWNKQRNGYLVMSQADMRELTETSVPTIRAFNNQMIANGRWEVNVGSGYVPTTYKPLFVEELPELKKKGN